jgi:hypothetical protein
MEFLRFLTLGNGVFSLPEHRGTAPGRSDFDNLDSLVADRHFRRDIAVRPDFTPFVREDAERAT